MLSDEYESVVEDMRLGSGLAWSLPVTVSVDEGQARELSENSEIALVDGTGEPVATMVVRELYGYDKEREARMVYRTTDADHPGVAAVYRQGDILLGGEVELLRPPDEGRFPATTTRRRSSGPPSLRRGGSGSSAFRPGTPFIGRTSTSRRAPSRRWTGSF